RCVEADDVLALVDHRAPPLVHDVALELDAERSVVISAPEPSIDLARLKHEASLFRERDHLLHEVDLLGRGVGRAHDFLARARKDVRKRLERRPSRGRMRKTDPATYAERFAVRRTG